MDRQQLLERIRTLTREIDKIFDLTVGPINEKSSTTESDVAVDIYTDQTRHLANELSWLQQWQQLRDAGILGIDIPAQYFETDEGLRYRNLTGFGENWVRRQVRDQRFVRVKD